MNLGSAAIGEWHRSADYGLDVARRAISAGEYPDVVAIVNRTLEALYAAGDPDPVRRLDLLVLLGAAQRALGDHAGFSTLERAVATARELGDGSRLADAVLAFTHGGAASDEHYIDHTLTGLYQEALKAVPEPDHQRRGRLLGHLAVADAFERGGPSVRHATEQALDSYAKRRTSRPCWRRWSSCVGRSGGISSSICRSAWSRRSLSSPPAWTSQASRLLGFCGGS